MNQAIIIGRLGKDPEIKHLTGGKSVANFSVATSRKINNEQITQWHNVVAWNKIADVVEKFVQKGALVAIQGEIIYRSYDANDGTKRYITEIVANFLEILSSKKENELNLA